MPSPILNSIKPVPEPLSDDLVPELSLTSKLVELLRTPSVKWEIGVILSELILQDQRPISAGIEQVVRRLLSEQPQGQP